MLKGFLISNQTYMNPVKYLLDLQIRRQDQIGIDGTVLALMIGIMMVMLSMVGLNLEMGMFAYTMLRMRVCCYKKCTRDGFTDRRNLILLR